MTPVAMGFIASLLAGLLTSVGVLPVLFGRVVSQRVNNALLGFAAGVMLSASFFSLIIPGLDTARVLYGGHMIAAAIATGGVLLGVALSPFLMSAFRTSIFFRGAKGRCAALLQESGYLSWRSRSTTCPKAWPSASDLPVVISREESL